MTKTKTVIQKSNRNLLSYVSNSRRETWASLNLKTEIAKTLKEGVSRLDHPNNHKFRDNTPDDMKKNIYLRTYKPEKIKCKDMQKEFKSRYLCEGKYDDRAPNRSNGWLR